MKKRNIMKKIIFFIFCILLISICILQFDGSPYGVLERIQANRNYMAFYGALPHNYIPFKTIGMYILQLPETIALRNLLGNIVLFIPFGIMAPWSTKILQNTKNFLIYSSLLWLGVELIQYGTLLGSPDVDDWILRMVGSYIGFKLFSKWSQKKKGGNNNYV